jgi:hypothetical protein
MPEFKRFCASWEGGCVNKLRQSYTTVTPRFYPGDPVAKGKTLENFVALNSGYRLIGQLNLDFFPQTRTR